MMGLDILGFGLLKRALWRRTAILFTCFCFQCHLQCNK